jgi:hypothetical protein
MTAVEWLQDIWMNEPLWSYEKIQQWFEQAKEMEKQQIIDAWEDGIDSFSTRNAEQYYNETYKQDI